MPTWTSSPLFEEVQEFVWNEWAQIGVLAHVRQPSPWAQDPEALLLLSLQVGRYDPRLFGEVLDWWAQNQQLISHRRLQSMSGDEDMRLVLGALTWVRGRPSEAQVSQEKWGPPESLFPDLSPPGSEQDPAFASVGLLAAPLEASGKSQAPDLMAPINLAFRLRQLMGVTARAEVVRLLLVNSGPGVSTSALASAAGFDTRNVRQALSSLMTAGFLTMIQVGSNQRYSIDRSAWATFLSVESDALDQDRDWAAISAVLRQLLRWASSRSDDLSDYMRASRARTFLEQLQPQLAPAGIDIGRPASFEESEESLQQATDQGLELLRPASPSTAAADLWARTGEPRPPLEVELVSTPSDRWRWNLRAANGRVVAVSDEQFVSRSNAMQAALWLRDRPGQLRFEVVQDEDGYSWIARTPDGVVVARSSDAYSSSFNARRAMERVRGSAAAETQRHVVPSGGSWTVRASGATRASAQVPTQREAIDRARAIVAKNGGGEVIVHGRDGRIRDQQMVPGSDSLQDPRAARG